jgi:hypothetical protein
MGCRMSRTISQPDLASPSATSGTDRKGIKDNSLTSGSFQLLTNSKESPRMTQGRITNGQSVLNRRDTPGSLLDIYTNRNGSGSNDSGNLIPSKPIGQIESASQADFFRMLDEKIAQGAHNLPDSDLEDH